MQTCLTEEKKQIRKIVSLSFLRLCSLNKTCAFQNFMVNNIMNRKQQYGIFHAWLV